MDSFIGDPVRVRKIISEAESLYESGVMRPASMAQGTDKWNESAIRGPKERGRRRECERQEQRGEERQRSRETTRDRHTERDREGEGQRETERDEETKRKEQESLTDTVSPR